MHPGIPLESAPEVKQPRDLSLMVLRIPSILTGATLKQSNSLALYLYDTTRATKKSPPQFLGGVEVTMEDGERVSSEFVDEIELEELLKQDTVVVVDVYSDTVQIASSTWEIVVVPLEDTFENSIDFELLGGILIFVGTFGLAFWMYKNMIRSKEIVQLQARAEAERAIVKSLFPRNVRDRLIREATAGNMRGSPKNESGATHALSSEKIFGSKPIADFFTCVTIMFADLVGFTAWSSARDPTQVFALLEVIYHSYDQMAKKRGVFKLETVGDCYVAVSGLPEPRDDHAELMAKFATDCLIKLHELTSSLELTMGPDTADLDIRVGLHSGPVTAGVLRDDKGRFQLFGDTMNTANRIESTGQRSKIHLSLETAELLKKAKKEHWLTVREDAVFAKGKGLLKTYWLDITSNTNQPEGVAGGNNAGLGLSIPGSNTTKSSTADARVNALKEENHNKRMERLITWSVEVFARLLKLVVAKRQAQGRAQNAGMLDYKQIPATGDLLEEVKDVVAMPEVNDVDDFERRVDSDSIDLDPQVERELDEYISVIAELYHRNPFHNFEHAGHVLMSTCKLLTRIVTPREGQGEGDDQDNFAARLHEDSYGMASDPLTRFASAFSALIHDVDHPGVPNATLVSEQTIMASTYKNKSVAEQNSIDLAWDLLMSERYNNLVKCICADEAELNRFRQLVVNMVMATDVMDKSIGAQRKARWEKAFSEQSVQEDAKENFNRKATIVIEHLIQASDVSHTMQHWHVYRKWNERLFYEMYKAYKSGRLDFDPSEKWYEGEIGFLDFYIIPLAKKLDTCGVFGVSSDELLNYAQANRKEWEAKGRDIVRSYLESYQERYEEDTLFIWFQRSQSVL
jgi:class 3 adenylate cyclase